MIILDGKKISEIEIKKLKEKVREINKKISLLIIQVGNLEESNKYISHKIKKSQEIGIEVNHVRFDGNIEEAELINKIKNIKDSYDGTIIQLPLPKHLDSQKILDTVDIDKDIDGLSSNNMNNFYKGIKPYNIPATARAILTLIQNYNIDIKDKSIMVIGESNLVGKPTKHLLSFYTDNIISKNKETGINGSENYDVLVVATGNPHLIKKQNVKDQAIVIDVGITIVNNKLIGDVDFDDVKEKVRAISPVPGGVGPLTVISLLKNLVEKFN